MKKLFSRREAVLLLSLLLIAGALFLLLFLLRGDGDGEWDDRTQKWKSAGKDNMDDVSTSDIKGVYVRFRPCKALREEINHASFFEVTNTLFGKTKGDKLNFNAAEPSNP